jgi:biopolymer transport protein ExbB
MVWEVIEGAGWPIWPLILTSVIGLAIIIERVWFLRESAILPAELSALAQEMVTQGHVDRAQLRAAGEGSMLGEILVSVLDNEGRSLEHLKDSVEQIGENKKYELERYLGALSTISTVAPLLGLFGTVIGMVELFSAFTLGSTDVGAFGRGISIALYNTAGGIVVAVPAMIGYRYFRSRVDYLLNRMEHYANQLADVLGQAKG